MEGMGGDLYSLDGNMSGEDWLPAQATRHPPTSSICICSPHQLRKEVKEAVEREVRALLPTILDGAVQRGIQNLLPVVIDAMKQMIPTIPPLLQTSTLPSASRSLLNLGGSGASRTLQLHFVGQPRKTIFTSKKLHEQGVYLTVELHNEYGVVVKDGPESSVTIKIVVLPGDFKVEDDLSGKDLSEHIVKVRANKPQTLVGKLEVALHKGVACFGDLMITDNSSWMTDKKFRLGAKVVGGLIPGVIIREAVSEAFRVKERRGENQQKKETPSLNDSVCCLHCIGKDGKIYQRLKVKGINTVKDLLTLNEADMKSLKEILKVSDSIFQKIMKQAASALNMATVPYGSNDATNLAYGNQTEGLAPNPQMSLPTQTIGAAAISLSANLGESEMQQRFNCSPENTMQSPVWNDEYEDCMRFLNFNSDTQNQAVRTFEEVRIKSSRKWCVLRAANWVISLRRIVLMASTRPQKRPRISLDQTP